MRLLIVLVILNLSFSPTAFARDPDWMRWGKKLIGENRQVRDKSVAELRKIKDLNETLTKALQGDEKNLALDVIVALGLENFIPELMELGLSDRDGTFFLAINGLLSSANKEKISNQYLALITNQLRQLSAANIVAMLDALGRMGKKIPTALWIKLFDHPYYEVRSAALTFLRVMYHDYRLRPSEDLLLLGLNSPSQQIRTQTAFLISEFRDSPKYADILNTCQQNTKKEIQRICGAAINANANTKRNSAKPSSTKGISE